MTPSEHPAKDPPFAVSRLEYALPQSLIAEQPAEQRDASRLLVLDRASGEIRDRHVFDLLDFLKIGDLLVINDTKVIPARLSAFRQSGGRIGGLFLHEISVGIWRVMLDSSSRLREGEVLKAEGADPAVEFRLLTRLGEGQWEVQVSTFEQAEALLKRIGSTPLPPYIERKRKSTPANTVDALRYQTVFARHPGAIAAPTAGLHLTNELLAGAEDRGAKITSVTLHVGPGTFKPIGTENLSQHVMHAERFSISQEASDAVARCKRDGGRVIAVGTTSVRVLETAANNGNGTNGVKALTGETRLFIYPPYHFRIVDLLMTNFHLPRSTLLAMVMAFAGEANIMAAYRHAVDQQYRFYSYGDAMLII